MDVRVGIGQLPRFASLTLGMPEASHGDTLGLVRELGETAA